MAVHVVLIEPEIPQNTGNISRTCAATGTHLHLVGPMGFSISDRWVRRAGLDYWDKLNLNVYENCEAFFAEHSDKPLLFCTTKADATYAERSYDGEVWFVFGCETRGLPEPLLRANPGRLIRIPMLPAIRSLNLSNAVAICVYEALRQQRFKGFALTGAFNQ